MRVRERKLAVADEERRFLRVGRRLDLNEPFAPVLFEREDVISRTITASPGRVFDSVREPLMASLDETPALVLHNKFFAGKTEALVPSLARQVVALRQRRRSIGGVLFSYLQLQWWRLYANRVESLDQG